jgi:hypothetical protein
MYFYDAFIKISDALFYGKNIFFFANLFYFSFETISFSVLITISADRKILLKSSFLLLE